MAKRKRIVGTSGARLILAVIAAILAYHPGPTPTSKAGLPNLAAAINVPGSGYQPHAQVPIYTPTSIAAAARTSSAAALLTGTTATQGAQTTSAPRLAQTIALSVLPPPPTPDPGRNFGVVDEGLQYLNEAALNVRFGAMRALGIRWVRYDVNWSKIQPFSANSYDWTGYDRVATALSANGLNGLGIIDYTPLWARLDKCSASDKCSPKDPSTFARFTGVVAARYSPKGMHTWEIWNEPNSTRSWLPAPSAASYTQMLKLSYQEIRHADARATVLTGGTSPCGTFNGNISPHDFLAGIYANGGQPFFDAVADHPYSRPFLPSFAYYWNGWQQMANTQPSIRTVMADHGDAAKKIWITEFGAATNGPGMVATTGLSLSELASDHVTESLQAKMATSAVGLYRAYAWAGPFFWYSYQDSGTSPTDPENFFGLIHANGTPKPAYYSYQQAIRQ